ncbi:hypothetical protein CHS0354_015152 [Potamilus streckersoni]|uniref:RZ-type domain-containing protein n=1 Tax=Potamilus streckersoni TaxID=2493646 RepID=A0AAE0SDF0_9BIVA|nr:hypothetical protein CHS0354_015152 [Potamilus streckersoni]
MDEANRGQQRHRRPQGGQRGVQAGVGLIPDVEQVNLDGGQARGGRGRGRGGNDEGPAAARRNRGPRRLGLQQLKDLAQQEPSTILMTVGARNTGLSQAITESRHDDAMFRALLKVFAIATQCHSAGQNLLDVYNMMREASFAENVIEYLLEHRKDMTIKQVIKDTVTMTKGFLNQLPNSVIFFLGMHRLLEDIVNEFRETSDLVDEEMWEEFRELTDLVARLKGRIKRRDKKTDDTDNAENREPPEDFREINVFPKTEDIIRNEDPFLRKNRPVGGYDSLDHYLDVQFRLLREDFIAPLRDGIFDYVTAVHDRGRAGKVKDVRIYDNVRVIAPVCCDNGLNHILLFDSSKLNVRWKSTKRLIYGSLVCLSPDLFNTLYFATVASRDPKDLERGIVHVRFEHDNAVVQTLRDQVFTMAESAAFFEAYRHILKGLQNVRDGDLPFENLIVLCDNVVQPPAYLRRNHNATVDLRPLVDEDIILKGDSRLERLGMVEDGETNYNFSEKSRPAQNVQVLNRASWPPPDLLQFDESQYRAFISAVTQEFTITQGPPGTGKTYIGLKIVKTLLHNRQLWSIGPDGNPDPRPMLIVCYTNHALDQFLEGLLSYFNGDIIRVGNRSTSEKLANYNLHNYRQRFRTGRQIPQEVYLNRIDARNEMELFKVEINRRAVEIQNARTNILHEDFLKSYMGDAYEQLLEEFQQILAFNPNAEDLLSKNYSVLVEWLSLGNLAAQMPGPVDAELPAFIHGQGDAGDNEEEEGIDVEDEVDVIQAQRRLDGDLGDDILDLIEQFEHSSIEERKNLEKIIDEIMVKGRAIALNVDQIDVKPKGESKDQWQRRRNERKKMKKSIQRNLSSSDIMGDEENNMVVNLWGLTEKDRWRLYRRWVSLYCAKLGEEIGQKEEKVEEASLRYREALMQEDKAILRHATIIGMTTTGAARYQSILQEIRPRIIVVEEAAEVFESHVVTTLNSGCEHVILIGDHKQLRPNPTVYKLAKDYNLDLSLFERMTNNKFPFQCLQLQHRMRPEISELMHNIYSDLQDHPCVQKFDNIKGVAKNLYFINHSEWEQEFGERSHSNLHEAKFIIALCKYLILQGYEPHMITVLTMYSGQLYCLKNFMPKSEFDGVRVTTVDNFQGEENDIILLSLVRSNQDGEVGFVKIANRICVALSRARKGLYVIGNFDLLQETSPVWKEMVLMMKRKNCFGPSLKLLCQNHPAAGGIDVTKAKDFEKVPEGGCNRKCEYRLKCGHVCARFCHMYDKDHEDYQCLKPCTREICDNGHQCKRKCYQECKTCDVMTIKIVPRCGHGQSMACGKNATEYVCQDNCEFKLPCGHNCQNECGASHTTNCQIIVERRWPCGHVGKVKCFERDHATCSSYCSDVLDCGHLCEGTCGSCFEGRVHRPCKHQCKRTLVCGHECEDSCKNCPPCRRPCENRCVHSKCGLSCGELCVPCKEPCEWKCSHFRCKKLCSEPCKRPRCNEPCTKNLRCGHPCIGLCGEKCPKYCRVCDKEIVTEIKFGREDEPDARFVQLEDCDHLVEVDAFDQWIGNVNDDSTANTIQLKVCPTCTTPIRRNLRYGRITNRALNEIEEVKKKVLGSRQRVQEVANSIKESMKNLPNTETPETVTKVKSLVNKATSERQYMALENQISILNSITRLIKRWEELRDVSFTAEKQKSVQLLQRLHDWTLEERSTMTQQEISDAKQEIARLESFLLLLMYQRNIRVLRKELHPHLRRQMQETERMICDGKRFIPDRQGVVKACLDELKKVAPLSGLGVSEEERLMIVQAMNFEKGHWFKCRNNHVYAIDDCGGALHAAVCPECQDEIGGTNYRLRPGNRLASEMDGALRMAWSNEANLENDEPRFFD